MDTVKRGRVKVEVGDCVSLPTTYWGDAYAKKLKCEHGVERLFGRVTDMNSNNDFTVVWDVDNQTSQYMSLAKCRYEPSDTAKQQLSTNNNTSTITAEDFQTAEESTSSHRINEEHALMVEEFQNILCEGKEDENVQAVMKVGKSGKKISKKGKKEENKKEEGKKYILLNGSDEEVMHGRIVETEPGEAVHNKPLEPNQKKFLITGVLESITTWLDYDPDLHCEGSFVAWDVDSTEILMEKSESKKKKFNLRIQATSVSKRKLRDRSGMVDYEEKGDVEDEGDGDLLEDENVQAVMKVGKSGKKISKKGKKEENKKEEGKKTQKVQKAKDNKEQKKDKKGRKAKEGNDFQDKELSDESEIEVESGSEGEDTEEEDEGKSKDKDAWKKAWNGP